jgi:predicted MFS family arabinose efflux permease
MFNYFKLSPLITSIIEDFKLSYGLVGLLAGSFGLLQLILSIPMSILVSRQNLRKATIYALLLMILGALIGGVASNLYLLFVGRLIEGAGTALALVTAPFLVSEVSAKERVGFGLGVLMIFMPIGNILGLNVGSWFLKLFGWRGAWLTGVILPTVTLPLILKSKPVERRIVSEPNTTTKSRGNEVWLLGLLQLSYSITGMGFLMWVPTYMIESYSFDVNVASFIASLFMVIGIPTPIIGAWFSDKVGSRKAVLAPSFSALTLLFALTTFTPSQLLPLHILAAGFFSGIVPSVIHICVVELFGPSSKIGFGILNASRGFSLLFGPLILGAILSATSSWTLSFASLSFFAFLAFVSSLLLPRIR